MSLIIACSAMPFLAATAGNIVIRSYDNANIVVETKTFTSDLSDKVVLKADDKSIPDVKIYEVVDGQKKLLFEGDLKIKGNFSANAMVFPYNMLVVKEYAGDTAVKSSLNAATLTDINTLIKALNAKGNEVKRLQLFKSYLKQYAFTTAQLTQLIAVFTNEDIRTDAALLAYDNVTDKSNYMPLYSMLMNAPDKGGVLETN